MCSTVDCEYIQIIIIRKVMLVNDIIRVFFFFQFGIGFVGNTTVLLLHIHTFLFQPHAKKPVDLIISHLTLANFMTLNLGVIPDIIFSLGTRNFMGDRDCKAVLYLFRVFRGLSLCNTSLLSLFQAIKIAPSNSRWAWFKLKISSYILPAFLSFWVTNLLIYIQVALMTQSPNNATNWRQVFNLKYCIAIRLNKLQLTATQGAMVMLDVLCVLLMICTSVYMVKLLFKHQKTVQRVHSASLHPRPSPETKATCTILALVSCFVFFYCTSCCFTMYVTNVESNQGMENIALLMSSCYPAICPCLVIKNNTRESFLKCTFGKRRKSQPDSLLINLSILTQAARGT